MRKEPRVANGNATNAAVYRYSGDAATAHRFRAACFPLLLTLTNLAYGDSASIEQGRSLAFARDKGNCLACHVITGGHQMGDIGPPLVDIRTRYPDKRRLYDQIWDASATNPRTLMPPYGRHEILTSGEIEAIIEFLYTQ